MQYLVTKALLDLHDKYDGEFGLLDERWASKEDREAFSPEQMRTLSEYINAIYSAKSAHLSQELRMRIRSRIKELEEHIDPQVLTILRERLAPDTN